MSEPDQSKMRANSSKFNVGWLNDKVLKVLITPLQAHSARVFCFFTVKIATDLNYCLLHRW